MRQLPSLLCIASLSFLACSPTNKVPADSSQPPPILDAPWTPSVSHHDAPFIQEQSVTVLPAKDIRAVVLDTDQQPVIATPNGALRLISGTWTPIKDVPAARADQCVAVNPAGILATAGSGGVTIDGHPVDLPSAGSATIVSPANGGSWWVAGPSFAGSCSVSGCSKIPDLAGKHVRALVSVAPNAWIAATDTGVVSNAHQWTSEDGLPSDDVRTVAVTPDGTTWAGTAAGLASLAKGATVWTAFVGKDGLHYGDIARVRVDAAGARLVATSMGASRYAPDGTRRYYFGKIWLPSPKVHDLARAKDGTVWIATDEGLARIDQVTMTLAEKAAYFDKLTELRHKRLGYTSTENGLKTPGNLDSFFTHDDDNDGQWTGMYLAAQSLRYAVTHDGQARENASEAANALLRLETVSGMDGFLARSVVPPGECKARQAAGAGEWHVSGDKKWCWKGDTSADELVGHTFGLSLYYDLVANDTEKAKVANVYGAMVRGIVEHGFQLIDVDGRPTQHGRFDPGWMHTNINALLGDGGLYSAIMLGALATAHHMTGDGRFVEAVQRLARDEGYSEMIGKIEEINLSVQINHDSEEMSFLALFPLMRYETKPELMDTWRKGLSGLWAVQRPERNPEFNMLYAVLMRVSDNDLKQAVTTLQRTPTDLVLWGLDSSHRWDAVPDAKLDRFDKAQNSFVFPYDERQPMRWSENPYAYRQRGDGHAEASGTFWLLPYWMGRWSGLIA